MTQVQTWCEGLQAKLMAAIDAAWAVIESGDDPAATQRAREKVRVCGQMAAAVRKVAAMSGPRKPAAVPEVEPVRGLDRLRGGGRGRL